MAYSVTLCVPGAITAFLGAWFSLLPLSPALAGTDVAGVVILIKSMF